MAYSAIGNNIALLDLINNNSNDLLLRWMELEEKEKTKEIIEQMYPAIFKVVLNNLDSEMKKTESVCIECMRANKYTVAPKCKKCKLVFICPAHIITHIIECDNPSPVTFSIAFSRKIININKKIYTLNNIEIIDCSSVTVTNGSPFGIKNERIILLLKAYREHYKTNTNNGFIDFIRILCINDIGNLSLFEKVLNNNCNSPQITGSDFAKIYMSDNFEKLKTPESLQANDKIICRWINNCFLETSSSCAFITP